MKNFKRVISVVSVMTLLTSLVTFAGCNNGAYQPEIDLVPNPDVEIVEATPAPELEGYNILWHDEFDGNELDFNTWSYDPHAPGWTNNELQEYTQSTDNVFVKDGNLVLKAIKKTIDGRNYYTSGKVKTKDKEDFLYGKVVARAKVPEGQGLYGEPHAEQQGVVTLDSGSFADSFHEYSVEWEPGEMRWYIDDNLYLTVNDWFTGEVGADEKPYPAPFDKTFYVQLNLAVGGTWPGNPDETTDFDNAEFLIDYVRVYQKDEYDTNVKKPEKVFLEADETGNFIRNCDFSVAENLDDDEDWKFLLFEGGEGSAEIKDNTMIIYTDAMGTVDYSVQLVQPDLPMIKGKNYRITFDCWAEEDRNLIVCISAPNAGWIRYFPDTLFNVRVEEIEELTPVEE